MKSFGLSAALILILIADPAAAAVLAGKVVGVADGDTITVLDESSTPHKIRLGAIDAPERQQPHSQRSKQFLSDLVFGREVAVHWDKRDRYGRIVGRVMVADPACKADCARSVDAGLAVVRAGYAWWYKQFSSEQAPADRERYGAAEAAARTGRVGLWVDEKPTAPWDFRKQKRSKRR